MKISPALDHREARTAVCSPHIVFEWTQEGRKDRRDPQRETWWSVSQQRCLDPTIRESQGLRRRSKNQSPSLLVLTTNPTEWMKVWHAFFAAFESPRLFALVVLACDNDCLKELERCTDAWIGAAVCLLTEQNLELNISIKKADMHETVGGY